MVQDYATLSRNAAQIIADELRRKPDLVLGLAAGNTPLGTYQELVRMHREEHLDFSRTIVFNLDEYGGLDRSPAQSFSDFLHLNFVNLIHIPKSNVHFLSYPSASVEFYCERFESEIREAGGIDMQILGIGRNGHIAFNEPGASIASRTRTVTLNPGNGPESPNNAITMGVASILESRRILLLASGKGKAAVLAKALEGPVTEKIPASFLQLHHDVIVIADEASATHLKKLKRAG